MKELHIKILSLLLLISMLFLIPFFGCNKFRDNAEIVDLKVYLDKGTSFPEEAISFYIKNGVCKMVLSDVNYSHENGIYIPDLKKKSEENISFKEANFISEVMDDIVGKQISDCSYTGDYVDLPFLIIEIKDKKYYISFLELLDKKYYLERKLYDLIREKFSDKLFFEHPFSE